MSVQEISTVHELSDAELRDRDEELSMRTGPTLSDGTTIRDLFDFDRREVALRTLNDPEIHELELEKIFAKAWVAVAHVAEIPEPGDYRSRYVGEDNVLVTRGHNGQVYVVLNVCAHKAMEICRTEEGNCQTFVCPYHGWAFDHSGRLLGAPVEIGMYGEDWDKSTYGLIEAKVAIYAGVIYASFDDNPPTIEEYLGDLAWYIDLNSAGCDPEDMVPIGGLQRYRRPSNWKTLSEQLAGDAYHGISLHRSLYDMGFFPPVEGRNGEVSWHTSWFENGNTLVSFRNGHSCLSFDVGIVMGGPKNTGKDWHKTRTDAIQIFPCSTGGILVGGLLPKGPGGYEMWAAPVVHPDFAGQAASVGGFGPGPNLVGVDDDQQGPSMQRAARGHVGRTRSSLKYNSSFGGTTNKPDDWPGPGRVYHGYPREDPQWNWWCQWFDMMTADD